MTDAVMSGGTLTGDPADHEATDGFYAELDEGGDGQPSGKHAHMMGAPDLPTYTPTNSDNAFRNLSTRTPYDPLSESSIGTLKKYLGIEISDTKETARAKARAFIRDLIVKGNHAPIVAFALQNVPRKSYWNMTFAAIYYNLKRLVQNEETELYLPREHYAQLPQLLRDSLAKIRQRLPGDRKHARGKLYRASSLAPNALTLKENETGQKVKKTTIDYMTMVGSPFTVMEELSTRQFRIPDRRMEPSEVNQAFLEIPVYPLDDGSITFLVNKDLEDPIVCDLRIAANGVLVRVTTFEELCLYYPHECTELANLIADCVHSPYRVVSSGVKINSSDVSPEATGLLRGGVSIEQSIKCTNHIQGRSFLTCIQLGCELIAPLPDETIKVDHIASSANKDFKGIRTGITVRSVDDAGDRRYEYSQPPTNFGNCDLAGEPLHATAAEAGLDHDVVYLPGRVSTDHYLNGAVVQHHATDPGHYQFQLCGRLSLVPNEKAAVRERVEYERGGTTYVTPGPTDVTQIEAAAGLADGSRMAAYRSWRAQRYVAHGCPAVNGHGLEPETMVSLRAVLNVERQRTQDESSIEEFIVSDPMFNNGSLDMILHPSVMPVVVAGHSFFKKFGKFLGFVAHRLAKRLGKAVKQELMTAIKKEAVPILLTAIMTLLA